ncbi:macro domain-containing protein [Streptomyces sp. NBC_01460]|uniref:macro domain-containing protein n=1 Tax=Streptomyces sp. NBC_01460 TaxID=2903875 RepID=UPI002E33ED19|nr:macro domain-containing protein [Streptomyces sp. NBC_01460]
MDALPSHQELIEELRCLRRLGFPRLRRCSRDGLRAAAVAAGFCADADDELEGIEDLLGSAARRLGGGELRDADDCDPLARAAAHSFGLFVFRRGVAAADRRKAAAGVYGVSTERFRKSQEREVLDGLASAVLALARSGRSGAVGDGGAGAPDRARPEPRTAVTTPLGGPVPGGLRPVPSASRPVLGSVAIRLTPIERIRDTDILVSSENVYLEMSKSFRPTVSGVLRRAAAERSNGEVVDDVLARELAVWLHANRRTGLGVQPGTVVPTSAGALSRQGIRRVYHAAVATPVDHGNRYHVAPGTVTDAVRGCFELARAERQSLALPLTSICFPLLGAGRGGLPPGDAAAQLLGAVRGELRRDPSWSVLLVTHKREFAELLRDANSAP